jgi:hypothetical protein
MRCFARGKASAITLAREIFTPQQKRSWTAIAENSHRESRKCDNFPELVNTPRMQWPALPSINQFRSSKQTLLAFWRGFSICGNQSIPSPADEWFGKMQRVFSPNPPARFSTPRFSILARSFA